MIDHSPPIEHTLSSIVITVKEVKNVLRNVNKVCGPDLISPKILITRQQEIFCKRVWMGVCYSLFIKNLAHYSSH